MKSRILIVDDSLTVRKDLEAAFERAGCEVFCRDSLKGARECLAGGGLDLIVLDLRLPDGDGLELLAEVRAAERTCALPVMLLTTESEVRDRLQGLALGADEFVGKPYIVENVIARARSLIGRRRGETGESQESTVLIIDDSPTYRAELSEALTLQGYKVLECSDGEEGLRVAALERPKALIVDGHMPGLDGNGMLRRLRLDPSLSSTPCLMLTGSRDQDSEVGALEAGADAYVQKHESMKVILTRFSAMLRGTSQDIEAPSGAAKRILAVDDSRTFLENLTERLQAEGYEVIQARGGEDALRMLSAAPVDAVLMDWIMPGMDGLQACRLIRASVIHSHLPLILMTAFEGPESLVTAIDAGADDFVSKDADMAILKARLRAQLRRKQLEDEKRRMRGEQRRLAAVAEASGAGVFEFDLDNPEHFELSPAGCALLGLDLDRPLKPPAFDSWLLSRIVPPQREDIITVFEELRSGKQESASFEAELHLAGSRPLTIFFLLKVVREVSGGGKERRLLVGGLLNRTHETNLQNQLRQAQKMEAIGRLAGGVAHDFNNQLTVIMGNSEQQMQDHTLKPDVRAAFQEIFEAAERSASLTRQLLAFSRRQVLRPEVFNLSALVKKASKMLDRLIGEQHALRLVNPDASSPVKMDPGLLEQVLANLVVNARDAMPDGGEIELKVDDLSLDTEGGHARGGLPDGHYVRLVVSDQGTGMDEETLARIFEPFFTTKSVEKGTGLGLSMVHGTITQSGGAVTVTSVVGSGTSFEILLPLAQESGTAVLSRLPNKSTGRGSGEQIVLVEDEPGVQAVIHKFLVKKGYEVRLFNDGGAALDFFEKESPRVDLLISDMIMPNVGGEALTRGLRQKYPNLCVILVSGYTEDSLDEKALADPRTAFLSKPLSLAQLLQVARELLDRTEKKSQ